MMTGRALNHIGKVGQIPSFSTYEERLHPYIRSVFESIDQAREIEVKGNNLVFKVGNREEQPPVALASHLDKINHYGEEFPDNLPVELSEEYIEGAMDDAAGVGMMLAVAEEYSTRNWPDMLFFFSEMEESKGLKEHPRLLRNGGRGYTNGMGARRISRHCIAEQLVPEVVITLDTTPLFKGDSGIALYSKHWELNDLDPAPALIESTEKAVARLIAADPRIKLDNNTNDYLHYGEVFNQEADQPVVSLALEPAIYPYHQKGERIFIKDIEQALQILDHYLGEYSE